MPAPVPFRSQLKDHLLGEVFLDYSAKSSPRPSSFPVDSSCPVRVPTQRPPPQKGPPSPACKATSRPRSPRRQSTLPAPSPGRRRHAGRGTLTSRNCTRPFSPSALRHSYAVPDCRKSCARHMLSLRNREPMAAPPRSTAAARAPAPWGSVTAATAATAQPPPQLPITPRPPRQPVPVPPRGPAHPKITNERSGLWQSVTTTRPIDTQEAGTLTGWTLRYFQSLFHWCVVFFFTDGIAL